jgi:hypothetical protein
MTNDRWEDSLYSICNQLPCEIEEETFVAAARWFFRWRKFMNEEGDPSFIFHVWCDFLFKYPQKVVENMEMDYVDFLRSHHWKIVREYVLYKNNYQCILCTSTENLNVHHRTYEHRGCEHKHILDLVVLCNSCHAKFHNKLEAEPVNG